MELHVEFFSKVLFSRMLINVQLEDPGKGDFTGLLFEEIPEPSAE